MTRHRRTSNVLRHRHRFVCWISRHDNSGLWLSVTWLFWTWDYLPPVVGMLIVGQVNDLRSGR